MSRFDVFQQMYIDYTQPQLLAECATLAKENEDHKNNAQLFEAALASKSDDMSALKSKVANLESKLEQFINRNRNNLDLPDLQNPVINQLEKMDHTNDDEQLYIRSKRSQLEISKLRERVSVLEMENRALSKEFADDGQCHALLEDASNTLIELLETKVDERTKTSEEFYLSAERCTKQELDDDDTLSAIGGQIAGAQEVILGMIADKQADISEVAGATKKKRNRKRKNKNFKIAEEGEIQYQDADLEEQLRDTTASNVDCGINNGQSQESHSKQSFDLSVTALMQCTKIKDFMISEEATLTTDQRNVNVVRITGENSSFHQAIDKDDGFQGSLFVTKVQGVNLEGGGAASMAESSFTPLDKEETSDVVQLAAAENSTVSHQVKVQGLSTEFGVEQYRSSGEKKKKKHRKRRNKFYKIDEEGEGQSRAESSEETDKTQEEKSWEGPSDFLKYGAHKREGQLDQVLKDILPGGGVVILESAPKLTETMGKHPNQRQDEALESYQAGQVQQGEVNQGEVQEDKVQQAETTFQDDSNEETTLTRTMSKKELHSNEKIAEETPMGPKVNAKQDEGYEEIREGKKIEDRRAVEQIPPGFDFDFLMRRGSQSDQSKAHQKSKMPSHDRQACHRIYKQAKSRKYGRKSSILLDIPVATSLHMADHPNPLKSPSAFRLVIFGLICIAFGYSIERIFGCFYTSTPLYTTGGDFQTPSKGELLMIEDTAFNHIYNASPTLQDSSLGLTADVSIPVTDVSTELVDKSAHTDLKIVENVTTMQTAVVTPTVTVKGVIPSHGTAIVSLKVIETVMSIQVVPYTLIVGNYVTTKSRPALKSTIKEKIKMVYANSTITLHSAMLDYQDHFLKGPVTSTAALGVVCVAFIGACAKLGVHHWLGF